MYDDWPVTLTRYDYQPNNLAGFRRVLEPIPQAMNHDEVERDVAAKLWPADGFCASVAEVHMH